MAKFSNIRQTLLEAFGGAKSSIYVAMAWFTDNELLHTLYQAHNRGVVIRIIVAPEDANSSILQADLPIYVFGRKYDEKSNGSKFLHSKYSIVDNKRVYTGSFNYTGNAENKHKENIAILDKPEDIGSYVADFVSLLSGSEPQNPGYPAYLFFVSEYYVKVGTTVVVQYRLPSEASNILIKGQDSESPSGKLEVVIYSTTTISLSFLFNGQQISDSQKITVYSPPRIARFEVTPDRIVERISNSELSWEVENAEVVEILPGIGKVQAVGTVMVAPEKTTEYRLRAHFRDAESTAVTKLRVLEVPRIREIAIPEKANIGFEYIINLQKPKPDLPKPVVKLPMITFSDVRLVTRDRSLNANIQHVTGKNDLRMVDLPKEGGWIVKQSLRLLEALFANSRKGLYVIAKLKRKYK